VVKKSKISRGASILSPFVPFLESKMCTGYLVCAKEGRQEREDWSKEKMVQSYAILHTQCVPASTRVHPTLCDIPRVEIVLIKNYLDDSKQSIISIFKFYNL
jgi:hypothetical protein